MKLYKVLVNGRSCHGGSLAWSLPTQAADGSWTPGEWHEVERVEMCRSGLHLTSEPARWHVVDCEVYEVEAEGVEGDDGTGDHKVVARRVRLLRMLSVAELAGVGILRGGSHTVNDGLVVAESATVTAYGSSTVTACGSSTVRAYDSSTVTAYDSSTVRAYDSSTVTAYDSSTVRAYGSSTVRAYDFSTVTAYGSSTVTAYGSSTVTACDSSTVISWGGKSIEIAGDAVLVDRRGKRPVATVAGGKNDTR